MTRVRTLRGRSDRAGSSTRDRSPNRRRDRGATVVEYALGIALIAIGSLGAVQFLEGNASDDFNDRANRSGAPDLVEAVDGGGTSGGTSGGTDGGDGSVTPIEVAFAGFSGAASHGSASKWSAVIEVTVHDLFGDGVDGVRVSGYWSYGTQQVPVVCNQSNANGVCRFQISDLPASALEVTFTMTDIGGGVPPVTYLGPDQTSDPISKPTGGGGPN